MPPKRKYSNYHIMTADQINFLAEEFQKRNYSHFWTDIFNKNVGVFQGTDAAKLSSYCSRTNLGLCRSPEDVEKWRKERLKEPTENAIPLSELTKKGYSGGNINPLPISTR